MNPNDMRIAAALRNIPGAQPTNPMVPPGNAPYAQAPMTPPQGDPVAIALARRNAMPPMPPPAPEAPPPAMGPVGSPLQGLGQIAQQYAASQAGQPGLLERFRANGSVGANQARAGERLANIRERFPQAFDRAQAFRAGNRPGFGPGGPRPANPPPRIMNPFPGGRG